MVLERALKKQTLANACRTILQCIGEDPDREGLVRTPERFAEAMLAFTSGYEQNISGTNHHHDHQSYAQSS